MRLYGYGWYECVYVCLLLIVPFLFVFSLFYFGFLLFDAESYTIEFGLCVLLCAMMLLSKTNDAIQHK